MPVTITDVLTNKRWTLPNNAVGQPIPLGLYPPGRYDVRNGTGLNIAVIVGNGKYVTIPNGVTWNIATQENDRSFHKICPDYQVWMHSGRFN